MKRVRMIPLTEEDFTQQVNQLARLRGWQIYHTWMSVKSASGFPDLVLVRPPRVVFAELKSDRLAAKVTLAQQDWLNALKQCPGVETYVWRPSDLESLMEVLR